MSASPVEPSAMWIADQGLAISAHRSPEPGRSPAPVPQQTTAHVVLAGDPRKRGTRLLAFGDDPQLLLDPPTASPLNSGNDFHPPCTPPLAALLRTPLRSDTGLGRTRRSPLDAYHSVSTDFTVKVTIGGGERLETLYHHRGILGW